jgi:hypothetical protein
MTKYQLINLLEKVDKLDVFLKEGIINQGLMVRYLRYKGLLKRMEEHPNEKRSLIILDYSIEMDVSRQTIYDDIRSMMKEIW